MKIFEMLRSTSPFTLSQVLTIMGFSFSAVVLIGIPLFRRARNKRRLKKILKAYDGEVAIACISYSRLSYVGYIPTLALMYLIANNEMLILTDALDSSCEIEIPFAKMVHYAFDGTNLIINLDNSDKLDVVFQAIENRDESFIRYALKHANIIDYIAARVPKKQVHVRL